MYELTFESSHGSVNCGNLLGRQIQFPFRRLSLDVCALPSERGVELLGESRGHLLRAFVSGKFGIPEAFGVNVRGVIRGARRGHIGLLVSVKKIVWEYGG